MLKLIKIRDIEVTDANKKDYIKAVANYKMTVEIQ